MKILYLLKEEPDEVIQQIISFQASSSQIKLVELYKLEISYEELVELIFDYDQVICW
jgi:hypothetical protein